MASQLRPLNQIPRLHATLLSTTTIWKLLDTLYSTLIRRERLATHQRLPTLGVTEPIDNRSMSRLGRTSLESKGNKQPTGLKRLRAYLSPSTVSTFSPLGPQHTLRRHAHDPRELATFAISTFSMSAKQWSTQQSYDLKKLQEMIDSSSFIRTNPTVSTENHMHEIMSCISGIFFIEGLQDVVFEWDSTLSDAGRSGQTAYNPNTGRVTITIDPAPCLAAVSPLICLLGTLLHECTHAFFYMYCCHSHSKKCPPKCMEIELTSLGRTGHSNSWTELASHVEHVARVNIDSRISLQILSGVDYEFRASRSILAEDAIARCHEDIKEALEQRRKNMIASIQECRGK